jgi:tetratricopeptide (TPR) repeat protein
MFTIRYSVVKDSFENIIDFLKSITIGLIILSLCSCAALSPKPEPEPVQPEPQEEVEVYPPPPPDALPPSKRVRKALDLLEQGDYENARLQLTWALQDKPTLQIALNLLEQMDVDPVEHLGMKSFFYYVESGDSLSIIAQKFLDDPLKFVILARYNKLENPGRLVQGQRIRVPGVMPEPQITKPKPKPKPVSPPEPAPVIQEPADEQAIDPSDAIEVEDQAVEQLEQQPPEQMTVVTQEQPSSVETQTSSQPLPVESVETQPPPMTVEEILNSARGLHSEGNLSAAIYLLEEEINKRPDVKALPTLLAGYYNEQAEQLINSGELNQARSTLEKLIILDSSDDSAINKLILVEDKIEALKLIQTAKDQESADNLEAAYQTYTQVLTYDPENSEAIVSQQRIRDMLTGNYHRRAMQLFRKQDLDEAIAYWNKILKLNPNHPLAAGYKARALEMKQQLLKIDQ